MQRELEAGMYDLSVVRASVFDSLEDQIAVIDESGVIIDTNTAWNNFGSENGLSGNSAAPGSNYLNTVRNACKAGDRLAGDADQGIIGVIQGALPDFYHEYPCHCPTAQRWFMMRVVPMVVDAKQLFVISHINITQRKLAEERAEYLSVHDPLTGLPNRRRFNEFFQQEMRRCARDRAAISLLMMDLDHFKQYNDGLGHPAGDDCLVKVGRVWESFARRPRDVAARLGGDEFALILGVTAAPDAYKMAQEIISAINALNLWIDEKQQITASIGVASLIPNTTNLESTLIACADKALYAAKAAGRGRAEIGL